LMVSGEEISHIIEKMVQFQENGAFNIDRYKAVLAANRMAPTKFEDSMRFDRLSELAAQEIGKFASVATDFEIQEIYSQQNEKIAVKYVKIAPGPFADKVTIDDEALRTWFETVKDNYKTEPQIKLKYLLFTNENVGQKITIDPNKIEEYYQNNRDTFQQPAQRHARHILLKTGPNDSEKQLEDQKKKAEEVRQLALNGGDFSALAKEYSEGPSKDSGGDLGFFSQGQMVPAFDDAVFAMQPGDISDVVKTRFGYHIIKLEEIRPAKTRPLDEVRGEITTLLQQKEAETLTFQMANSAYEGIIGAGSLAKYADSNPDIHPEETDFFTRGNAPADLAAEPQVLEKAFELNKGELSSLIKGKSGYAILFTEDIKEPEIPPFETKKDILEKDYRKVKAEEMAETAAGELLQNLRDGKDFSAEAQKLGLTVQESGFVDRNGQSGQTTFPSSLTGQAFLLSSASPLPEKPGKVGEDFFVYTFLDRQIPTMPDNSEEVAKYRENLLQFKKQQLVSAWLRHMESEAEIIQNPSL